MNNVVTKNEFDGIPVSEMTEEMRLAAIRAELVRLGLEVYKLSEQLLFKNGNACILLNFILG